MSIIEGGDQSFNVPKSMHHSQIFVYKDMTVAMTDKIHLLQGSSHVSEP